MTIDEFWKRLQGYGVDIPMDIQRRVGLELNQERVMIRPPTTVCNKIRVLELGNDVPATHVARDLGITVRRVLQIRRDLFK